MAQHSYSFTALRGIQAGHEYYLVMCHLKLIPRLFIFDEPEVPPELRSQRLLNKSRIPEITRYIVDHPKEYTFSAITASIDGDVEFIPLEQSGIARNMGELRVDMQARFLINDGQHRRAALEEALKVRPELGNETIAVVFFLDIGLKQSQQMFADLNKHAVRPSQSISVLYDHRNEKAKLAKKVAEQVSVFKNRTDLEKTSISNRSSKIFTLSGVYQATEALLKQTNLSGPKKEKLAVEFWEHIATLFPEWHWAIDGKVSPMDLRQNYVHVHGVILHALGIVGNQLLTLYPQDWQTRLQPLSQVDWRRTNPTWEGRAISGGRMSKAQNNLLLTATYLKSILHLPLTNEEEQLEERLFSANKIGELDHV
ncbi:MAG TPA: DNA sulfur modification protein DndB [Ktedonobacteraceae bacterium]|nr:DNA sulfur modification protein DndB [Ktedonobacteraceae bacterium]